MARAKPRAVSQVARRREALSLEESADARAQQEALANSRRRFDSTARLWTLTEQQLGHRTKQHELMKQRYEAGKASALELGQAELELGAARLERTRVANALQIAVMDVAEAQHLGDPRPLFQ